MDIRNKQKMYKETLINSSGKKPKYQKKDLDGLFLP